MKDKKEMIKRRADFKKTLENHLKSVEQFDALHIFVIADGNVGMDSSGIATNAEQALLIFKLREFANYLEFRLKRNFRNSLLEDGEEDIKEKADLSYMN